MLGLCSAQRFSSDSPMYAIQAWYKFAGGAFSAHTCFGTRASPVQQKRQAAEAARSEAQLQCPWRLQHAHCGTCLSKYRSATVAGRATG